jgi:hypothetical protein
MTKLQLLKDYLEDLLKATKGETERAKGVREGIENALDAVDLYKIGEDK